MFIFNRWKFLHSNFKDEKENYSLIKNMFECLNINLKVKKEQNYKDNSSNGFVIEIFYETNNIEDSFLIELKKDIKKNGRFFIFYFF